MMKNHSLGLNAALNGLKQLCSIIFPLISFSYCAHILNSSALGALFFNQSVVSYFLLLATLGIPNYAIREGAQLKNNKEKISAFVNELFSLSCITTIIAYICLFLMIFYIEKLYTYRYLMIIQSFQIMLTTLGIDWINSIYEDYLYLTLRYIIIQCICMIALFLFVKKTSDIYMYAIINTFSVAGGNVWNWFYLKKTLPYKIKFIYRINIKKHLIPVFVLFFNSVATVIYLNSDITILGLFTNDSIVGIYSVSSKIYSLVKSMINAMIMVTVPRFSYYLAHNKKESYKKDLNILFNSLILFIFPIMIGIFLEADKILLLIAGEEYISGKIVLKFLSMALIFAVGACYFSYSILIPYHMEQYFMLSTIGAAVINILLNFLFIKRWGMISASITTLIAEIFVFLFSAAFSFRVIKIRLDLRFIISVLFSSSLIVLVCKLMDSMLFYNKYLLIIEIIVSIIAYLGGLIISKNQILIIFWSKIKKLKNYLNL